MEGELFYVIESETTALVEPFLISNACPNIYIYFFLGGGGGRGEERGVPHLVLAPVQVPSFCLVKQYNNSSTDPFFLQVTYKVFLETGLFEAFQIPMTKFLNFFFALESGYHEIPCKYLCYLSTVFFKYPVVVFVSSNKNKHALF